MVRSILAILCVSSAEWLCACGGDDGAGAPARCTGNTGPEGGPATPASDFAETGIRRLGPDELLIARPGDLRAGGGLVVIGSEQTPTTLAVLERSAGQWRTVATAPAADAPCAQFAVRVATDGRTVVSSAFPGLDCRDPMGTSLVAYERVPGTDELRGVPLPEGVATGQIRASGLAINGDRLVAGLLEPGTFYPWQQIEVFDRTGGVFRRESSLKPPTPCFNLFLDCWGGFGDDLVLVGTRLVVGAGDADHTRPGSGRVLVYDAAPEGLRLTQTVVASDAAPEGYLPRACFDAPCAPAPMWGEGFGSDVAVYGDRVVAVSSRQSAAYSLADVGGTLEQRAKTFFGSEDISVRGPSTVRRVAQSRDHLAVAELGTNAPWNQEDGAVFLFRRVGDDWARFRRLTLPSTKARFGTGMAIVDDRWLIVTAPGQEPAGAVYEIDLAALGEGPLPDAWACETTTSGR